MKILIDVGHPAHVHLFKNFTWIMQKEGHRILFTTRNKECSIYLLDRYGFEHLSLGSARVRIFDKITSLWQNSLKILKISRKFKPDIFLSHGSICNAFVSKILGKPHISFEDTGNLEQILLYKPFTSVILSPESLKINLGKTHIKYRGYHELTYLHPKYFNPNSNVLKELGVKESEKFVIIRFSVHAATHDFGYRGLPLQYKVKCVEEFSKHAKVFISSEEKIAPCLEKFSIKIPPEKMHDAIYYASLVYSEGAKSASEASVLGTPSIYVYFKCLDYITNQKKYGTIFSFTGKTEDIEKSIQKGVELLNESNTKEHCHAKREQIVNDNIDVTAFMVWFVENYPKSVKIIRDNPENQFKFI